ncbi:hypothetical protein HYS93_00460 [Candidatus Daviesbacteria bacterium]|nr:hypothetical protein [Candidatus Daviesbacteria bacterium]
MENTSSSNDKLSQIGIKKIIVKILILGLVIFSLLLLHFLSNLYSLRDLNISSLKIGDRQYSLEKGRVSSFDKNYLKVINLASFYILIKEDPLFIPTIDDNELKKLEESIRSLDQTQNFVLKENLLREKVFPTDFLLEVVNVGRQTNLFLENPSDQSAKDLVDYYKKTILKYQQSIDKLSESIDQAPKEKYLERPYVFINIALTPQTVKKDLETIKKNVQALSQEINRREDCLKGKRGCRVPSKQFGSVADLRLSKLTPPTALPPDILFGPEFKIFTLKGPYGVKSACWGFGDSFSKKMNFLYITNLNNRLPIEKIQEAEQPKLINLSFYRRLNLQVPADKLLIDQGLSWQHQTETNTYMCPDLSYQTILATIDRVVKEKPMLFKQLKNLDFKKTQKLSELINKGLEVEENFYNYPNEDNLEALTSYYLATYKILNSYGTNLADQADKFLKMHLLIKGKITNLSSLLNNLNHDFLSMGLRGVTGDYHYDSYYIYGLRSAYSLTYLSFSPFVWKEKNLPEYMDKRLVKNAVSEESNYMEYSQAKNKYSDSDIKTWYPRQELMIYDLYLKKL